MFHLADGLFFEKLPDGWVRITKHENAGPDSPIVFQITTDASGWASIIDTISDKPKPQEAEIPIESEAQP